MVGCWWEAEDGAQADHRVCGCVLGARESPALLVLIPDQPGLPLEDLVVPVQPSLPSLHFQTPPPALLEMARALFSNCVYAVFL